LEEATLLLSNVFEDGVGSIESEPCVFIETQESGVTVNIFSQVVDIFAIVRFKSVKQDIKDGIAFFLRRRVFNYIDLFFEEGVVFEEEVFSCISNEMNQTQLSFGMRVHCMYWFGDTLKSSVTTIITLFNPLLLRSLIT